MWSGSFGPHPGSARHGWRADWVFTDRRGGVSDGDFSSLNLADHVGDDDQAVSQNRRIVADSFGSPAVGVAVIRAEHGHRVRVVTGSSGEVIDPGDGLVTTQSDIALVALAADCSPVVLADVENSVIGVVHCGWRGIVAGIVPATIDRMQELGASVSSTSAVVGPSICCDCYRVDQECAEQLRTVSTTAATCDTNGQWYADVPGTVEAILTERGIQTRVIDECTFTSSQLFSYRRDHRTGRQGAAVVLRGPGVAP